MFNDDVKATGLVHFVLTDVYGNVKHTHTQNIVVDTGLAYIASRMKDATAQVMSHVAVGTGTTAAADAQTALFTEISRVALSATTIVTTTVANDAVQYTATFSPGQGTGALTEAGIFNSASSGSMLARTAFPVINKGDLDTFAITWKITIA